MGTVKRNGYECNNQIFEFAKNNPGKIKPVHGFLYTWIWQKNNKSNWIEVFELPTIEAMQMTGIKNRQTFSKALSALEGFGLISIISRSPNQKIANKITLLFGTQKDDWPSTKNVQADNPASTKNVQAASKNCIGSLQKLYRQDGLHLIIETKPIKTFFKSEKVNSLFEDFIKEKKEMTEKRRKALMDLLIDKSGGNDSFAYEMIRKALAGNYPTFIELTDKEKNEISLETYSSDLVSGFPSIISPQPVARGVFTPPTEQEVIKYFQEQGYNEKSARLAFNTYDVNQWQGVSAENWMTRMAKHYFKPENKIKQ